MSKTFPFPQDLLAAQTALHAASAEYHEYARTLPWSAEPMPGWESDKQLHSAYRASRPDSPGYTEEQAEHLAAHRARVLELSVAVMTHPFWATLDDDVVAARMALKRAHKRPAEAGA